jgi:hypothetical protein
MAADLRFKLSYPVGMSSPEFKGTLIPRLRSLSGKETRTKWWKLVVLKSKTSSRVFDAFIKADG